MSWKPDQSHAMSSDGASCVRCGVVAREFSVTLPCLYRPSPEALSAGDAQECADSELIHYAKAAIARGGKDTPSLVTKWLAEAFVKHYSLLASRSAVTDQTVPAVPIPASHQQSADRFGRMFKQVPLSDVERLPDPDYEASRASAPPPNLFKSSESDEYICQHCGGWLTDHACADRPSTTPSASLTEQVLLDAAEIRSACGFMWMRMTVIKDAQDAFDVSKREFESHQDAFKRLETSLPSALAALRQAPYLQTTDQAVIDCMGSVPVCAANGCQWPKTAGYREGEGPAFPPQDDPEGRHDHD